MIDMDGIGMYAYAKDMLSEYTKQFEDMDKLTNLLSENSLLSVTNFNTLKSALITDKHIDKLNVIFMKYGVLRAFLPKLDTAMSNMFFTNDKIVEADILKYEKLSEADKRLFEIIVILKT